MSESLTDKATRFFLYYRQGKTLSQIGEIEELSRQRVHAILSRVPEYREMQKGKVKKRVKPTRTVHTLISKGQFHLEYYVWGHTLKAIGERRNRGLSPTEVRQLLDKWKIPEPERLRSINQKQIEEAKERSDTVLHFLRRGWNCEEIAKKINLNAGSVRNLVGRYGLREQYDKTLAQKRRQQRKARYKRMADKERLQTEQV